MRFLFSICVFIISLVMVNCGVMMKREEPGDVESRQVLLGAGAGGLPGLGGLGGLPGLGGLAGLGGTDQILNQFLQPFFSLFVKTLTNPSLASLAEGFPFNLNQGLLSL